MESQHISKDFCQELDKILMPVLGNDYTIIRKPNGVYIFYTHHYRVISVHPDNPTNVHSVQAE